MSFVPAQISQSRDQPRYHEGGDQRTYAANDHGGRSADARRDESGLEFTELRTAAGKRRVGGGYPAP